MTNLAESETSAPETTWLQWLNAVAGPNARPQISRLAAIDQSTVYRWFAFRAMPSALNAVAVARAFNADPVGALVAAGYLTADDVEAKSVDPRNIPTDLLLGELDRRTRPRRS